jgi:hypothetical protein
MPKMSNTKAIEAILKMDREERKKGVREKEKNFKNLKYLWLLGNLKMPHQWLNKDLLID